MKIKFIFLLVLFFVNPNGVSSVETRGAQFLYLKTNSKAEALNGAVTAKDEDLYFLQQNPASCARLKKSEALFTQAFLFQGLKFSSLAYGQPSSLGVLVLDFRALQYGEFESTNEKRELQGHQSPKDWSFGVGWSADKKLFQIQNLFLGGSVHYLESDLVVRKAGTVAFNFGALYKTVLEGVQLGVSVTNAGPPLKFERESNPLPQMFRLGVVYNTEELSFLPIRVATSLDSVFWSDWKPAFLAGLEVQCDRLLNFQIGFSGEEGLEDRVQYGFGIGIEGIEIHYAASPMALGTRHFITLKTRFEGELVKLFRIALKKRQNQREEILISESNPILVSPTIPTIEPHPTVAATPKIKRENAELKVKYEHACQLMLKRKLEGAIPLFREIYSQDKHYLDSTQKLAACLEGRGVQYYANRQYLLALRDIQEGLALNAQNHRLKEFLKDTRIMLKNSPEPLEKNE